ncbi:MAG: hypothetical protein ACFFG0_40915 [Candidatus Thorarchaeota archaeon]
MVNIERMVRQAVLDHVVYCPNCKHGYLKPDYGTCPECHKPNPLREGDLSEKISYREN